MLKDILKYTEKAGIRSEIEPLRAAYKIMVVVPKNANDMMDVGRLQGFEVCLLIFQGNFQLNLTFLVWENNSSGKTASARFLNCF